MANASLVSILVPVYNGERFLRECLDSILDQDYEPLEILIADDGSTDGSVALLTDYAARDARIRWWRNPQNLGLVENWNCLLQSAHGEYIKFVFQDDKLLSPSAVRMMAETLDGQPGIILVASASQVIDEHSSILETRDNFPAGVSNGRQVVMRCLKHCGNLIGEPTVVMFRQCQATMGFNSQYRQIVDLEFFFQLLEQGDLGYVPKPLAAFRQHADQATAKNHHAGITNQEQLLLMQKYLAQPWVSQQVKREVRFHLLRGCRKSDAPEMLALQAETMRQLGRGWFWTCWLKHKITNFLK